MSIKTDSLTSATTKFAEDQHGTFVSAKGGSIDIVGITPSKNLNQSQIAQIMNHANDLIASLGSAPQMAKQAALGGIVAAAASTAALGGIDPTAVFVGSAAALTGAFSKGSTGRG